MKSKCDSLLHCLRLVVSIDQSSHPIQLNPLLVPTLFHAVENIAKVLEFQFQNAQHGLLGPNPLLGTLQPHYQRSKHQRQNIEIHFGARYEGHLPQVLHEVTQHRLMSKGERSHQVNQLGLPRFQALDPTGGQEPIPGKFRDYFARQVVEEAHHNATQYMGGVLGQLEGAK